MALELLSAVWQFTDHATRMPGTQVSAAAYPALAPANRAMHRPFVAALQPAGIVAFLQAW